MVLQDRDIQALTFLARYFMMSASQLRRLCYPEDTTGRITRRRLLKMVHAGHVFKRAMFVVNPRDGSHTPVYHLTAQGREFVAVHCDDATIRRRPIEPSQPQHLWHYLAVTETHILFDLALALHPEVKILTWHGEDDVINPDEQDTQKRRTLFTVVSTSPKRVCVPDAALLLDFQGHRAAFYIEQDRDTFSADRTAARKSPGYAAMLAASGHLQHFPNATLPYFFVVVLAPTAKRRDQLRMEFSKRNKDHDALKVYRFAAFDELSAESLLFEPKFSCCHHDDKVPLIRRSTEAEASS